MNLFDFLSQHNISYSKYEHPAVFTVTEADKYASGFPGAHTKNLFLRDKKGKRHLLVVAGSHTPVNLKDLSKTVGVSNLSFASPERLMRHLGIEPGSVSLLALFNDRINQKVEVVFERRIWEAETICCHPLVNTATLVIDKEGIERFLQATGHGVTLIDLADEPIT